MTATVLAKASGSNVSHIRDVSPFPDVHQLTFTSKSTRDCHCLT
jgi:hypothetical protein